MLSLLVLGAAVQARSGGYVQSCQDVEFQYNAPSGGYFDDPEGYNLIAQCWNSDGVTVSNDMVVGDCIGNDNNELVYLPG